MRLLSFASVALLALPIYAQAPSPAAGGPLTGFEPNGDFVLSLGGVDTKNVEIYYSESAVSYLILAPDLASPVMLNLRSRAVESVNLMKVVKKDDGTIDVLAGSRLAHLGTFEVAGASEVAFTVDGKAAKLREKPPLLGLHQGSQLLGYNPEYARKASLYTPDAALLQALRSEPRAVRVRVYFGSWCPVCKRLVPNVLKVAAALAGSQIAFEFYGLPKPMDGDPETARAGIHGVPLLVVFVAGTEAGRLSGEDLLAPEAALRRLLGAS